MKFEDFQRQLRKNIFTRREAQIICFAENHATLDVQLQNWVKGGRLVKLKNGLYVFNNCVPTTKEIAESLYTPCYFSLEYILSLRGVMPEAAFAYTLVTTKATRNFKTNFGRFVYRKIKREAFVGFDDQTLLADTEKAVVDYFYLNMSDLKFSADFWKELRWNTEELDFKKVFYFAKFFKSKKLANLLNNFYNYEKSNKTN